MDVLYVDNHLLVVNKPAGLLTQPSGTDQNSLEALAKAWVKKEYQKPGNVFLEAVHRIDKPVSGIVLFARTSKALPRLQQAMREKESQKLYLAWVEGIPSRSEATLEHYLVHGDHQAIVSTQNNTDAKRAVLDYKVLETKEGKSLLEITLHTGRYHQIRAQLAAIGHPIVGDGRYGSRFPYKEGQIMLHHYKLTLSHPITNELTTFISNPGFTTT